MIPLRLGFALPLRLRDLSGEVRLKEFDIAAIRDGGVSVGGDLRGSVKILREMSLEQRIAEARRLPQVIFFGQWVFDAFFNEFTKTDEVQVLALAVPGELSQCLPVPPHFLV